MIRHGRFSFVLCFIAVSISCRAQAPSWKQIGFGGAGNFIGVHFSPSQPDVMYALSDVSGVLRSSDAGQRWEIRSNGLGNYEVSSFAVDPFNADILYAGVGAYHTSDKAGIYRSTDAGRSWTHLPATALNGITFRRFRTASAIACHPAQQGVILSGSRRNGIWRSTDHGVNWSHVFDAPMTNAPHTQVENLVQDDEPAPYRAPVSTLLFNPSNPLIVFAGLDGAGIVKSTNGGAANSWKPINTGLPAEAKVTALAAGRNDTMYAAVAADGIYRSINGGTLWTPVNNNLPLDGTTWISSIALHPVQSSIAYLTLVTYDYTAVWKTIDGGATWMEKGDYEFDPGMNPTRHWATNNTLTWMVTIDPRAPARLLLANFWSIFYSEDGGERWIEKIAGAQNTCVTDLLLDIDHPPGQPDILYASHWDAGILSSSDKGASWTMELPSPGGGSGIPVEGHVWKMAISKSGNTKYHFATNDPWETDFGHLLRKTHGTDWTELFSNPRPAGTWMSGAMLGLAVDPSQPSVIYTLQDGGNIFRSSDFGVSWSPTTGQPADNSFTGALSVDEQGRVFVGTLLGGLYRSTNGGAAWQRILPAQSTIFQLERIPGAMFASAGDANLYRTTNGGTTWTKLTQFTSVDDGDGVGDQGMAIAVDPNDPDHILFSRDDTDHHADDGPGIFETYDGGNNWNPFNQGLGLLKIRRLLIGDDGTIYAGTACGGIWMYASNLPPLAAPLLKSPANGSAEVTIPVTLEWNFVPEAESYHLQAAVDSLFSTILLDEPSLLSTSRSLSGIGRGVRVFWRVRARKGTARGPWSSIWSFTTKMGIPSAPLLTSPADSTADIPIDPIFRWQSAGSPVTYRLQVATTPLFSSTVFDDNTITSTSRQVTGLAHLTKYYWRVNATSSSGTGDWSDIWQFTTVIAPPLPPVLIFPSNGASGVELQTSLRWNPAPRASSYSLQLSIHSDFREMLVDTAGLADSTFLLTGLSVNAAYYWRMRSSNIGGTSTWSPVSSFSTTSGLPVAPELELPVDNATNIPVLPQLRWRSAFRAISYQLQVGTDANFVIPPAFDQDGIVDTQKSVSGLQKNIRYYWRVRAENTLGESAWSAVWNFTTEAPVSVPQTGTRPAEPTLGTSYPHPVRSFSTVEIGIPAAGRVTVKLYRFPGIEVRTLLDEERDPGTHTISLDTRRMPPGLYYMQLRSGSTTVQKAMLILR